jgi:hypothetical protein
MADTPTAKQIISLIEQTEALLTKLKEEQWSDYDPTLQKAIMLLMKPGFAAFQKAAKAISRVRPEETRASYVPGEPWYEGILDRMQ